MSSSKESSKCEKLEQKIVKHEILSIEESNKSQCLEFENKPVKHESYAINEGPNI